MHDYLTQLLERKREEVAVLNAAMQSDSQHPLHTVKALAESHFAQALHAKPVAIIAEIKRRSPSKPELAAIVDPVTLAQHYVAGGASAISVLTDKKGFGGDLDDLRAIKKALPHIPVLRKDFIIDEVQLRESVFAGADAILLIVAVLKEKTRSLLQAARDYNLSVLVEVHTREELVYALDIGADIIGINNRNLTNFTLDVDTALHLRPLIPAGVISVAESGIHTPELAQRYIKAGFDALLIGEALVTAENPQQLIQHYRGYHATAG